jgi:cytosine/uracil/thiamine/allantoin permease
MGEMGNIFAPIAGVLVVHYVVLKRGQIDVNALFIRGDRYWYWQGFNWVAIAWTLFGYVISKFIPMNLINIATTCIVTGVLYWATMMVLRPYSNVLRRGSEPAQSIDLDQLQINRDSIEKHSI